ncbi:MAG: 1-acyl-sn-glycerol-3-phosphate acyltransferase [Sphaerochaetaceae bacterium]
MSKTPLILHLARPTYGLYLRFHHGISTAGFEHIPSTGSHLVLANHTHSLDPFFISVLYPHHIRWVAGAYLFKNQILRTLLHYLVGAIGKQQGRSDIQTIRQIREALNRGENVGIFPEGTRTWDGESLGFNDSIAKLVKLFKVPVVLLNLEGSYALRPRWTYLSRKGKMVIRVVEVLSAKQINSLSVEQLHQELLQKLSFNFDSWQKEHLIPYRRKRRTSGVAQLLYSCPNCKSHSTIWDKKDRILCKKCDLVLQLDQYDTLHTLVGKPIKWTTLAQWHTWQKKEIDPQKQPFPFDKGRLLQRGFDDKLVTLATAIDVQLESDAIVVNMRSVPKTGMLQGIEQIIFDFDRISSMIINTKGTLEFYHRSQLWRLRLARGRCMLKYLEWYDKRSALHASEEQKGSV